MPRFLMQEETDPDLVQMGRLCAAVGYTPQQCWELTIEERDAIVEGYNYLHRRE